MAVIGDGAEENVDYLETRHGLIKVPKSKTPMKDCNCHLFATPHYHASEDPHSVEVKFECPEHDKQQRYWLIHKERQEYCKYCHADTAEKCCRDFFVNGIRQHRSDCPTTDIAEKQHTSECAANCEMLIKCVCYCHSSPTTDTSSVEIECICKENLAAKECPIHWPAYNTAEKKLLPNPEDDGPHAKGNKPTTDTTDWKKKIEWGAKRFAKDFTGAMQELAEEDTSDWRVRYYNLGRQLRIQCPTAELPDDVEAFIATLLEEQRMRYENRK